MANKLGFYLQSFEIGEHKPDLFRAIQEVRPPVILVHAWDQVDQLRRLAPQAFIIGRMTYFGPQQTPLESLVSNWLNDSHPEDRGREFAEHILHDNFDAALKREGDRLRIDAWMSLNEVVPGPDSDAFKVHPSEIGRKLHAYDEFQVGFRNKLMEHGIEAVAFNLAAGNFSTAKQYLEFFPNTLASYTYLGFHEYGWPFISKAVDAQAEGSGGTYRGIMVGLRQALHRDYQAILTEAGLTFMYKFSKSGFDEGWLFKPPPEFPSPRLTQDQYWASLKWLNDTMIGDAFAKGACLSEVGHAGKWQNFRHFGTDNDNQPITLMERMKGLGREAPAHLGLDAAAPPPPQDFTGQVADQDGSPIPGAMVRMTSGLETLGADPRAISSARGTVTWTRPVTGFDGSLWNCWQKYAASRVAAITWEEFRREAAQYNPSLRDTDDVMQADRQYFLPENRSNSDNAGKASDIIWDRVLEDFDGDLWACWRNNLQGKVVGVSWESFRRQVSEHNPALASSQKGKGKPKTIVLPRNNAHDEYTRVAFTDAQGRFRFEALPSGAYRLEVSADRYLTHTRELTTPVKGKVVIGLEAPLPAVPGGEALALGATADEFVQRVGREFVLHGRKFRFIGVNLRGLIHYEQNPGRPLAKVHEQLQSARDMGVRVVRVFAPYAEVSAADTVVRLANLLKRLDNEFPEMYLIVSLCNLYNDVPFRVPGDDAAYTLRPEGSGRHILGLDWFRGGYKGPYFSFARAIVTAFRDNPRIMAYNVGNELKAEQDGALLVDFMVTMAKQIKDWDGRRHLVTTGMISTRHAWMKDREDLRTKLYSSNDIDFVTNHYYHDRDHPELPSIEDDGALAAKVGKPLLIEEAGIEGTGDRSRFFENDMRITLDGKGASGFMPWGYMSGQDNDDGDRDLGIDHIWHNADWDRLRGMLRERSQALAADNPIVNVPRPVGKFAVGQSVFTQVEVWLRRAPAGDKIQKVPPRTQVMITGTSQARDLTWWPVRVGSTTGFMAQADQFSNVLLGAS
jgi:hypothetical protein